MLLTALVDAKGWETEPWQGREPEAKDSFFRAKLLSSLQPHPRICGFLSLTTVYPYKRTFEGQI